MLRTIFDELVFHAAPLDERPSGTSPELTLTFPVGNGGKASFTQAAPLLARRPPMTHNEINWPAYCGLLKDVGIPLRAAVSEMEQLTISNVPLRVGQRAWLQGFDLADLESADMLEISCIATGDGTTRLPHLPLELSSWYELKQLIESLRDVAGARTDRTQSVSR